MSQTCTACNGCGQVVKPVLVWDNERKQYVTLQRAVTCESCSGSGRTGR